MGRFLATRRGAAPTPTGKGVDHPPKEWLPTYLPGMLTGPAPQKMAGQVLTLMSGIRPRANLAMLEPMANTDPQAAAAFNQEVRTFLRVVP